MAGVVFQDVSKTYPGGVTAVEHLDLAVRDGEFLVLLGPSGCGKTTTLRLMAGLEDVTAGEIQIGSQVVNRVPPKDRDIAMVFQNYALYPHMSVYRNMAFGLQLRHGGRWLSRGSRFWRRWFGGSRHDEAAGAGERPVWTRREIRELVRDTAGTLGIEHLLERFPRQLSGGERQRVALGRAMVRQPAVFLFDEPLSNLDAKLRQETRRELKQLHQRLATTMVYVTHDQTEALTLGQRVAVMNGGRLLQLGTPEQVYDQPENLFVAGFIGSPPMNRIRGRTGEAAAGTSAFHAARIEPGLRVPAVDRDRPVVLGVRAEDVSLEATPRHTRRLGTGRLEMVESLGSTAYAHVRIAGQGREANDSAVSVVCQTDPRSRLESGTEVALWVAEDRLHWFDAETGQRVRNLTEDRASTKLQ